MSIDLMQTATNMTASTNSLQKNALRNYVHAALKTYFEQLDGQTPANLHQMVIGEVEPPLLETVMRFTQGNQSVAAAILGINRATLRKKLKQYRITFSTLNSREHKNA
jgi:Fis family transcriptional regulator